MKARKKKYIIGIDEVGRGALAGPVVVAAVCLPANLRISQKKLGTLKDSKKLSPKMRKLWTEYFKSVKKISYKVAGVHPRAIERINISQAANRAASRASDRLIDSLGLPPDNFKIFLDGGLFIKNGEEYGAKTVIKGDEKITAVKAASIIAKVRRDKYMEKLSRKHPAYGFEVHKGYGTRAHMNAIRKYGPSEVHRLTFLRFSRKLQDKS
ncbi:MAG TPA: ribonuclease HII [Candidatus Paceibacterota bacterium]|nr:ribonuclease HII [Candidatus Paceibacterota bacterium]